jgi:IstB-like ATP binding protein
MQGLGWHARKRVCARTNGCGQKLRGLRLAQKACRDGYSALYTRAQSLFRDLAIARADGSLCSLLARLIRIDVLVIDDWAMSISE